MKETKKLKGLRARLAALLTWFLEDDPAHEELEAYRKSVATQSPGWRPDLYPKPTGSFTISPPLGTVGNYEYIKDPEGDRPAKPGEWFYSKTDEGYYTGYWKRLAGTDKQISIQRDEIPPLALAALDKLPASKWRRPTTTGCFSCSTPNESAKPGSTDQDRLDALTSALQHLRQMEEDAKASLAQDKVQVMGRALHALLLGPGAVIIQPYSFRVDSISNYQYNTYMGHSRKSEVTTLTGLSLVVDAYFETPHLPMLIKRGDHFTLAK